MRPVLPSSLLVLSLPMLVGTRCSEPLDVTFELENRDTGAVHLYASWEEMGPDNRVDPLGSRITREVFTEDEVGTRISLYAGRNGQVLDESWLYPVHQRIFDDRDLGLQIDQVYEFYQGEITRVAGEGGCLGAENR